MLGFTIECIVSHLIAVQMRICGQYAKLQMLARTNPYLNRKPSAIPIPNPNPNLHKTPFYPLYDPQILKSAFYPRP